jgi:hypothetical protein
MCTVERFSDPSAITDLELWHLHRQPTQPVTRQWIQLKEQRNRSQLAIALDEFHQILTPDQSSQLKSYSSHAPTTDDIVWLTDQLIKSNSSRKSHLVASQLQGLLGHVQQYCNIIDTCTGPNQIAALVWGSMKLALLVCSSEQVFAILT